MLLIFYFEKTVAEKSIGVRECICLPVSSISHDHTSSRMWNRL